MDAGLHCTVSHSLENFDISETFSPQLRYDRKSCEFSLNSSEAVGSNTIFCGHAHEGLMATAFNSSDPGHDADRQACQGDALAVRIGTVAILCVRIDPDAPLLQSAHNILDDTLNRLCPSVNRQELIEEDATAEVAGLLRAHGWQSAGFAQKLSTGPRAPLGRTGACGMGSNQRHRKRVSSLALAALLLCEAPQRGDHDYLFACHPGLRPLARLCFRQLQQPADAPFEPIMQPPSYVSPNMAPPGLTPMQPPISVQPPIPVQAPARPPRNGKERLQQMARSYGADEEVLEDPYLSVQESSGSVICAACNKHLTAAHSESKKHKGYLMDINGTLTWLRNERPEVVCLRILELQPNHPFGQVAASQAPAAPAPAPTPATPYPAAPAAPAGWAPTTVWETEPNVAPQWTQPTEADRFPMPPADLPTPEEICDFLMRFTGRDQNCSQRKWVSYGWVSKDGQLPPEYPGRPEEQFEEIEC
eukprot:symbB.v1.2.035406.t1/scaffold4761.1/size49086/2